MAVSEFGLKKWLKKPVEISAMLFSGSSAELHGVISWLEGHVPHFDPLSEEQPEKGWSIDPATGFLLIATLEGVMQAKPGDYIIQGIQGEFYPCKPDIFKASYEEVREY